MRPLLPLVILLAGCPAPDGDKKEDTGETGAPEGIADLAVGEVAEMVSDADRVWVEVVQPGTYVVILTSTDAARGTLHGYGDAAEAASVTLPPDPRPAGPGSDLPVLAVAEGDTRTFDVWNGSRTVEVEAEAIEVTDRIVVWEDRTTENAYEDMDSDMLADIVAGLEDIVLPREEQLFGEFSDVDADGRVHVLLSYTVNQYGPQAYVTSCDIGDFVGCWGGNDGEIVYLGYVDPEDSRASASGRIETIAHELAHLVYAWHKYLLNGATESVENIYVTEGTSALAQDLTGYNNGNQYVWGAALDMADYYGSEDYSVQALSLNDLLRGDAYYDEDRDGALRGGAYLFLRYLFEQAGGMEIGGDGSFTDLGGIAWLHDFFSAPETGVDAVEATSGRPLWDVALDWYTALVVSGRGINSDPAWNYQDRVEDPLTGYDHGVDPYANIHGWLQLTGPRVQAWDEADGAIRAGGVEYLQVTVEAGELSLPVSSAAEARARIFRIE